MHDTESPVQVLVLPPAWAASTAPLEVDVGSHKGTFLVAMAELYPAHRFLGIEKQSSRVDRCRKKIDRLAMVNAFAVQGEGLAVLRELRLEASVIHVSFPDPWPKRRHHIRRMVGREFLVEAWHVITRGGMLRLMTDDEPYFRAMEEAAAACDGFEPVAWNDGRVYPPTEFQLKFELLPIYRLALRRCDSMSSE
jgi:tRNA (guanine-N7-)-methyltransferase